MKAQIEQISQQFFEQLSVQFSGISVEEQAENIFLIQVQTDDSHLLIGPHGKHLESLTLLLKLLIGNSVNENVIVHVEVNDYLQQKDEKLFGYIKSKMEIVEKSGNDFRLPFFTAYERKKVHSFVSTQNGSIYTKSMGEGKERRIYLCKKDSKITIDIDGDDI